MNEEKTKNYTKFVGMGFWIIGEVSGELKGFSMKVSKDILVRSGSAFGSLISYGSLELSRAQSEGFWRISLILSK